MIIQFLIFSLILLNSITFFFMNHPISLGIILMSQTLLISLMTGIFTKTFWFSYSLFLIFIGGMLILFMYMTSLASNETFNWKLNFFMIFFMIMFFFIMIISLNYFFDLKIFFNFNNKTFNMENLSMKKFIFMMEKSENFLLNKMFNLPMNFITIMMVNYLFLTLISTVKITNIFKGPMRQKNF